MFNSKPEITVVIKSRIQVFTHANNEKSVKQIEKALICMVMLLQVEIVEFVYHYLLEISTSIRVLDYQSVTPIID